MTLEMFFIISSNIPVSRRVRGMGEEGSIETWDSVTDNIWILNAFFVDCDPKGSFSYHFEVLPLEGRSFEVLPR